MLTKKETLHNISALAAKQAITKEELNEAFDAGNQPRLEIETPKKFSAAEILYYIGGAVVFLGIAILLSQNWSILGFSTKVLATLGSGSAVYVVGILLSQDARTNTASSAFYLISALITPLGLWVIFDHAGFDANSYSTQSLISGILLVIYLGSYFILRKNIFILFSIIFATWLFFSFTNFLVGSAPFFSEWKYYMYRTLAVSTSYILLGYAFSKNKHIPLSGFLYGFGIFGFLGAALALSSWKPHQNLFWELIYPVLVFGALFLSVRIKNKTFLLCGTLFLMAYILKITSEHFSHGLGWPFALVLSGLAMIGVGYISLIIKKKYLSA